MHPSPRLLLEGLAAAGTLGCLFFYGLACAGLASFLKSRRKANELARSGDEYLPPVSILKPLKGVDPEIWDSFCSHAEQDYPEFELIFGVSDAGDPARDLVRRLQDKYPARAIKLVVADHILGANVKVSTLAQMVPEARYDVLLVNDSDIRVTADYLREVVAPLRDSQVGVVTCLYRGMAAATLGSRLEALGIATDFAPGVLSARFLEGGLRFGLGSTLAFRRAELEAIGGFEAILDYLADDYELGRRIAATGKRVELGSATVATFLPAYTLGEFWRHQLRWWRTIRDARRWGYAGLLFTFGLPWALLTVVAARGAAWAWALFAVTVAARLLSGLGTAVWALQDRGVAAEYSSAAVARFRCAGGLGGGIFGNRIHWRGDDFILRQGKLSRG